MRERPTPKPIIIPITLPIAKYLQLYTYTYIPIPIYLYLYTYTYIHIPIYLYLYTYTYITIPLYLYLYLYAYIYPMPYKIQPIRGLESRCIFCGIQRVAFHPAFLPLLASDYRNGAKTVCVRFRNGAKVVGQRRESLKRQHKQ